MGSRGLGTNNIGSLALDPNDRTGNTIFVGTGETNTPNNSGAGTGLYRSVDGGDRWTRVPTMIMDPGSPGADRLHVDARDQHHRHRSAQFADDLHRDLDGHARHDGRARRPDSDDGSQPRVGLYKTEDGDRAGRCSGCRRSSRSFRPIRIWRWRGRHDVRRTSREARPARRRRSCMPPPGTTRFTARRRRSRMATPRSSRSSRSSEAPRFRDLAMFDLTVKNGRTRIYVYNGTGRGGAAGACIGSTMPTCRPRASSPGAGRRSPTRPRGSSSPRTIPVSLGSPAGGSASQCFYDLVVATPAGQPDQWSSAASRLPTFGEPTIRSTDAGATFNGSARTPESAESIAMSTSARWSSIRRDPAIVWSAPTAVSSGTTAVTPICRQCSSLFNNAAHCQSVLERGAEDDSTSSTRASTRMQFYNSRWTRRLRSGG